MSKQTPNTPLPDREPNSAKLSTNTKQHNAIKRPTSEQHEPATQAAQNSFEQQLTKRAKRKLDARQRSQRSVWFGLGMFGLVGWSVAVPALIGTMAGIWFDRHYPGAPSWTLSLLIVGMFLGSLNAWFWIKQESNRDTTDD